MEFQTTAFQIGKNRIEALSDGNFAIVMTLLILKLRVPNLPPSAPNVERSNTLQCQESGGNRKNCSPTKSCPSQTQDPTTH